MWPHGTPGPCRPSSSQIPENWVNAANSWIPADGRSRTRTWGLFLIRKSFFAASPPKSQIIPGNRCDGASGRGLEGTGGDKLVAPSWPHDRGSRARCRMTWKRTSRRRYGQTRTLRRRVNGVDRGKPRRVVELVHHVTVGLQGQPGTVTELARDIQPSARHAASTTSLAVVPKRRRGCEETGAAADDLLASQPTSPSREIRGERPT